MSIRYHENPATGQPHIYDHGVNEDEVEEALDDRLAEDRSNGNSRVVYGRTAAGRYLKIVYVPDNGFDDILVVTAFDVRGKRLRALRRRLRRKYGKRR